MKKTPRLTIQRHTLKTLDTSALEKAAGGKMPTRDPISDGDCGPTVGCSQGLGCPSQQFC